MKNEITEKTATAKYPDFGHYLTSSFQKTNNLTKTRANLGLTNLI